MARKWREEVQTARKWQENGKKMARWGIWWRDGSRISPVRMGCEHEALGSSGQVLLMNQGDVPRD